MSKILSVKNVFILILSVILFVSTFGLIQTFNKDTKITNAATNIALGKKVSSTSGNDESRLVDGNTDMNSFWVGEPYPASFEIDLGAVYDVTSVNLYMYSDGRYYHYKILVSANGVDYTQFAIKNDTTANGNVNTYNGNAVARYVKVDFTYNSANLGIHVREIEIFGTSHSGYSYTAPSTSPIDANDVAYRKPVSTNMTFMNPQCLTDGSTTSFWRTKWLPAYVDIDLQQNYSLSQVILNFTETDKYYYYTIYGSVDADKFDRLYQKGSSNKALPNANGDVINVSGNYRYVRVYLQHQQDRNGGGLVNVRVHGTALGTNTANDRNGSLDDILGMTSWEQSTYSQTITNQETIDNVYGIVERVVGKLYKDWFEFKLEPSTNGLDSYKLTNTQDGKILITGNNGLSLASGVNFYFQKYAKVNVTEQANHTFMPKQIIPVDGTDEIESPYETRYAFNYCTMDYSFAFFTEADFQKEYDYLALNGINLALDLVGQEAVWIKFLMNFGYSFDSAKAWLCGPAYYAWQFMDNMEIYGGAVTDGWVKERLESARRMQRWRLSLGMQTCLQAYVGMVPNDFNDYQPQVELLEQGTWCGMDRPDMIRTDSAIYDQYAELFYEAQEWAFGPTSNYYAADPFHEGGIRPSDGSLTDDVVASELASSLIKYDANGVWVIQAWHSNPTNKLLHGLEGVREDHALVLDLCALEAPKWNRTVYGEDGEGGTTLDSIEFNGTPWVWCMLENYGGNPSMDGELQNIIDQLNIANQTAEHLKGIGIIAEATLDNPALYNMLFDMGWRSVELKTWLKEYTTARYGRHSENVEKAWELIEESVYNKQNGWYRTTPWILTAIPEWRQYNQTMPYDYVKLEQALELLLKDYDLLCGSEGYRYDLVEIMQHIVSHYACMMHNEVYSAFTAKNLTAFRAARAKFEACFPIMNDVLGCRTEWLAGEWIRRAEDWGDILDNDFARDNLVENAKMLITSWADQMALRAIPDYAVRHYEGMLIDLYQARWTVWLDKQDANLANGTPIKQLGLDDYYYVYREWIYNGKTYTKTANEDLNHLREVATNVLANATTIKASMTGYSYSFEILAKFQQKFALIDKTRYSESQIATINEVMTRLNQAENASLTQEDYYTLLTDAYKADVIFANPQGHTHNYQAETTPNADNLAAGKTCTEYAKYYKVCSVCGAKSTVTYDYIAGGKLDHEYSYVSDGEAGHHKDCDNCSDVTATENHDFQGGNTCKDCGYTKPVASSSSSAPSSSSQEPSSSSSKQEVSSSSSEVVSSSSSSQQVSSSSTMVSSSNQTAKPSKRGCNGSVGSVGLVTLLGLTAVAVLKKKSKR